MDYYFYIICAGTLMMKIIPADDDAHSHQLSGISTESHIWVEFLQNKVVPLFQLLPQSTALDKVYVCHVRNVPHSPRNRNKGELVWQMITLVEEEAF